MTTAGRSIAVRVSVALMIATTSLMLVIGGLSHRAVRALLEEDFERDQANLVEQLAVALALPAWNFDREQIERVIEGALRNENVTAVTVRLVDQNGAVVTRQQPRAPQGGEVVRLVRAIRIEARELGTVELTAVTHVMERAIMRYVAWMAAAGVAFIVLLVAGLYWQLWRIVLRPVAEMEAFAQARSQAGDAASSVGDRHYVGELESLRRSLERMVAGLEERHEDLRRTTERLEMERVKLQALFAIVPTGISITDEARHVRELNPALERILGLTAAEIAAGKHLAHGYRRDGTAIGPEDWPSVRAVREQRPVLDVEIAVRPGDGTEKWVSVSAAPLAGYGAAVVTTDITERVRAEQQLRGQVEELRRWQQVTLHREDRVRELKAEVNELCRRRGVPPRYRDAGQGGEETT